MKIEQTPNLSNQELCQFCLAGQAPEPQTSAIEVVFDCGTSFFRDEPNTIYRHQPCQDGEDVIKRYQAQQAAPTARN